MSYVLRLKSIVKAESIAYAHRADMSKPDYSELKDAPAWHQRAFGMYVLNMASFEEFWAIEKAFKEILQFDRYRLFRGSEFLRLMPFELEKAYDLMVEFDMLHRGNDAVVEERFGPDAVDPEKSKSFWRQVEEFVDKAGPLVEEGFLVRNKVYLFMDKTS